jgi:hypothetical protein
MCPSEHFQGSFCSLPPETSCGSQPWASFAKSGWDSAKLSLLLILTNEIEGSRLGRFAIWQVCRSGLTLAINTPKSPLIPGSWAKFQSRVNIPTYGKEKGSSSPFWAHSYLFGPCLPRRQLGRNSLWVGYEVALYFGS